MDEESQDEKPILSRYSRYRSPGFSSDEVQTLVNIVEKYKYTILNKSTNSAANLAKEVCWEKIAKIYNTKGFKHERSPDHLKTKWENLKREIRKLSKNLIDDNNTSHNDLTRQIVAMMCEVENNPSAGPCQNPDDSDESNEPVLSDRKLSQNKKKKSVWNNWEENYCDESNDGDDKKRINRSLNFAPEECTLLLECVRKEKNHIFSKETTAHALELKSKAWKKITEAFNARSPQKRSPKVLRTKFDNMKRVSRHMGIYKDAVKNFDLNNTKHEKLDNETSPPKTIKSEPVFEMELDGDNDDGGNSDSNHSAPDPLSTVLTVLNSDSGNGSTHSSSWSQENKDVAKLKLELLNYKMETARLERQQIEEASAREAAVLEANALASALRLRAARLEAVAAAERLPQAHPALLFTPEEQPAERYLRQYEDT